ncbi:MAG: phosphoribosyltransferase family protein [Candidatus Caldarchaeum sp.]
MLRRVGKCPLGWAPFAYEGLVRELIAEFKFRSNFSAGDALSYLLSANLPDDLPPCDVVVPVPLHPSRLRQRGFNQSAILGRAVAKTLNIPSNPFLLERVRNTRPQFELETEEDRRGNVRGAFRASPLRGKKVLLVDDVLTSGATADECVSALADAGASSVFVVALSATQQTKIDFEWGML